MDLSQETDDYIRESIEYSLGLPVSTQTLQLKLKASEQSLFCLRNQNFSLQSKLKEKDEMIERARAESTMNAIALKKFVEENQRLAVECSNLLAQCKRWEKECKKWEKECSLYDHDREALMDFGNEADERAKQAETRVLDLEDENRKLSEELQFYKCQYESQMEDDTAKDDVSVEQNLVDTLLETVINRDDVASRACAFLEKNIGVEVCQGLLKKWTRLKPSMQKVVALAAEVKTMQKNEEHLRMNLNKAEEEVDVLSEDYKALAEENKMLMRLYQKEKLTPGSGGKLSSGKGSKRKSSSKISSQGSDDFSEVDSLRPPLSPLRENSPEYRLHKK